MRASRTLAPLALAIASCLVPALAAANATIVIINGNAPGVGFNDTTPAAPVGGNTGTTIGQQRLIAFQHAADLWGAQLDSNVTINVAATFEPLSCTATSAVLGSAGATQIFAEFPGAPLPQTWYHSALADKIARVDLGSGADLRARFNSNLGNVGCLTGTGFYYGLDTNHGSQIDLVTVLLHEFAHGLGFSSFTNVSTGAPLAGLPGVYERNLYNSRLDKTWPQMTDAERVASAIDYGRSVWTGETANSAAPSVLSYGRPLLRVSSPPAVAGTYAVGTASFGPALSSPGVSAQLVAGLDGVAPASDACTPLANAADVAGKLVLVDRGTCTFNVKAANVQAAGGIGMVVADNAPGEPPAGLGGADPSITIPSARVSLTTGNALKAQLANNIQATLGVDLSVLAGTDDLGRLQVNAPSPVQPGSSVSHWDPVTNRNQLMEPAINADLTHSVTVPEDLTRAQLRDVGWFPDADLDGVNDETDACLGSTLGGNVSIDSCATGVPNTFFANGCTIQDELDDCAKSATTHEGYTACTTQYTNLLKDLGTINNKQKAKIQACAGKADIP